MYINHTGLNEAEIKRTEEFREKLEKLMSDYNIGLEIHGTYDDYYSSDVTNDIYIVNRDSEERNRKEREAEARYKGYNGPYDNSIFLHDAMQRVPNKYNLNLSSLSLLEVVDKKFIKDTFRKFGDGLRFDIYDLDGINYHFVIYLKDGESVLEHHHSISNLPQKFYDLSNSQYEIDAVSVVLSVVNEWLDKGYVKLNDDSDITHYVYVPVMFVGIHTDAARQDILDTIDNQSYSKNLSGLGLAKICGKRVDWFYVDGNYIVNDEKVIEEQERELELYGNHRGTIYAQMGDYYVYEVTRSRAVTSVIHNVELIDVMNIHQLVLNEWK